MKLFRLGFAILTTAFVISASAATSINGAGATFPAPLYTKWLLDFNKENPSIEINYQSIGSGGGIKQLTGKTVDFGASDAPMTDKELEAAGSPVLHIPTVLGAVVLTYNVPEIKQPLKLTGAAIADVFVGKITKWNDPQIAATNKGVALPNTDIIVTYRSDSSGTTAVFTEYLSKVSSTFKSAVGEGKTVKWPVGLGGKGNEGVAASVKNTPGSIGYVELSYGKSSGLPMALIQNKAGTFVEASVKSVSDAAAASAKSIPDDFRVSISNAEGKNSYPISAFTYLLVYKNLPAGKGDALLKFINWSLDKGQKSAPAMLYAPLPPALVTKVKAKLKTVTVK